MTDKKQYLSVDKKNFRRHSAPETPVLQKSRKFFRNYIKRRNWCTASVSDFSILLEYQSDSSSSLELDTSNLSGDTTPVLTSKSTLRGSYQDLSTVDYDIHEKYYENNSSRNAFGTW